LQSFENLASLGAKLRKLHLMEENIPYFQNMEYLVANFPVQGDNIIEKPEYTPKSHDTKSPPEGDLGGCIFINPAQYFDNVPVSAWNFYIGGYQPAQKWLKDRCGRVLNYDDIRHYQKIIAALCETGRIMNEIDNNRKQ
jgi:predicted helicase